MELAERVENSTPNLPTKIIPTKIRWLKTSGKTTNPFKSRFCLSQILQNPEA